MQMPKSSDTSSMSGSGPSEGGEGEWSRAGQLLIEGTASIRLIDV